MLRLPPPRGAATRDDLDLRGRHVVLVHNKRVLVGEKTKADYGIETGYTLWT